jgi:hypothetical protein
VCVLLCDFFGSTYFGDSSELLGGCSLSRLIAVAQSSVTVPLFLYSFYCLFTFGLLVYECNGAVVFWFFFFGGHICNFEGYVP